MGHLSMAGLVFQEIEIDTMYEHIPSMNTCCLVWTQNSISNVADFCVYTRLGKAVCPLWKSDSFLWISDKKQIHLLKISDKKQTQPYKKSDNFNCFPAAFWLHRKRFFSWPFFGVLSHLVDLYLISNEEPSKGKKQIYLQCEGKSCSNSSRFAC